MATLCSFPGPSVNMTFASQFCGDSVVQGVLVILYVA